MSEQQQNLKLNSLNIVEAQKQKLMEWIKKNLRKLIISVIGVIALIFYWAGCGSGLNLPDLFNNPPITTDTTYLQDSLNSHIADLERHISILEMSKDENNTTLINQSSEISDLKARVSRRDSEIAFLKANPIIEKVLVAMEDGEKDAEMERTANKLIENQKALEANRKFILTLQDNLSQKRIEFAELENKYNKATDDQPYNKTITVPNGKVTITAIVSGSEVIDFAHKYQSTEPLTNNVVTKLPYFKDHLILGVGVNNYFGDFSSDAGINVGWLHHTPLMNNRLSWQVQAQWKDRGIDLGNLTPNQSQFYFGGGVAIGLNRFK